MAAVRGIAGFLPRASHIYRAPYFARGRPLSCYEIYRRYPSSYESVQANPEWMLMSDHKNWGTLVSSTALLFFLFSASRDSALWQLHTRRGAGDKERLHL